MDCLLRDGADPGVALRQGVVRRELATKIPRQMYGDTFVDIRAHLEGFFSRYEFEKVSIGLKVQ